MKILIAAGIYPPDPGGPALHAWRQHKWFCEHGHQSEVVALSAYRYLPPGVRHLAYLLNLLTKAWKSEIVFAHDALGAGLPALIAAKVFFKKFVVRIGGDVAWERMAEGGTSISMLEWYESGAYVNDKNFHRSKFLLRQCDRVFVPSEILKSIYTKYYGITSEVIVVMPNPLPKATTGSGDRGETIIFASRLVAYKNLDFVIRVMARIFSKHPDLKLVVLGDGPEMIPLTTLSRELDVTDNVIFKGLVSQEEVEREIAKCCFTIAPALTEFNPNYVLLGLSLGKPFLISREQGLGLGVPPELQFDPRSEGELESRILALLEPQSYAETVKTLKNLGPRKDWDEYLIESLKELESLV